MKNRDFSIRVTSLYDLMLHLIRSVYNSDQLLFESLPTLKDKTVAYNLREMIEFEAEEKESQRERLDHIFTLLKETPEGVTNLITQYLIHVLEQSVEKCKTSDLADSLIIILNRALIHNEINAYQTAISCSIALGYTEVTILLRRCLLTEKGIENKLRMLEEIHLHGVMLEEETFLE